VIGEKSNAKPDGNANADGFGESIFGGIL